MDPRCKRGTSRCLVDAQPTTLSTSALYAAWLLEDEIDSLLAKYPQPRTHSREREEKRRVEGAEASLRRGILHLSGHLSEQNPIYDLDHRHHH